MNILERQTDLDFASIEFFDDHVVCTVRENVTIDIDKVVRLHQLYRKHYGEKKYGYIFDRTADSTIDPISYMKCPYYPDVTAFAMVAPDISTKNAIKFEEKFSQKKLHIFETVEEAKDWLTHYHEELGMR